MKILNLGYNPINKINQNTNSKQQNPAFKGKLVAKLQDMAEFPFFRETLEQMAMTMAISNRHSLVKEPFVTRKGKGMEIVLEFDEGLDKFARKKVWEHATLPQDQVVPGFSLDFIPNEPKAKQGKLLQFIRNNI